VRAHERLDQRLVAARPPCWCRHALRRHDQLPAAAALQAKIDAEVLPRLTAEDLTDLGVTAVGISSAP
jgi:hypothetical protein